MAGIYIHIPYCKTRCPYCDFFTQTDQTTRPSYVEALLREMEMRRDYLSGARIQTIYFGGGTPSLLTPHELMRILDHIYGLFPVEEKPEITLECNPDDVDKDYFRAVYTSGINRLSLGTQSFDDRELAFLGRRHDATQNDNALEEALASGFENISVDLIYGLPGTTEGSLVDNLARAFAYPISHLSAYHLTIEPDTPFGRQLKDGQLKELPEEMSARQFQNLITYTRNQGMEQYELSNFAYPGYHSRHNSSYWQQKPYLGLGPSAHSYNTRNRHWNIPDLQHYLNSIHNNTLPLEEETLELRDHFNEYLITGLRTAQGISLEAVDRRYGNDYLEHLKHQAKPYIDSGKLILDDNCLRLSEEGKFISDSILREIIYE